MVAELKEQEFNLVGTGFSERAIPLTEWDFTKPTAVILGNEHRGMDAGLSHLIFMVVIRAPKVFGARWGLPST